MTSVRRFISIALIVSITGLGLPLPAQAGMLATPTAAASSAKDRILGVLERNDVRAQLQALGVNPADAKARVATLSDEEAAQLAARMDSLPAGGDGFGALIGAAVLIFLVLLLTDILGVTHVFSFTKPINK
ncbi:MAG TPA: PA2779 family protein [Burkholderiales bacterium]|nr:PA2779 family protein [Burkholderiales bacterium]